MSAVNEYHTFIEPLRDNPDDETTRLAYTDWLDERNDPRAEYLRTEAAWAALQPTDEQYRPLYRRVSELATAQDATWFTWVGRMSNIVRQVWEPVSDGFKSFRPVEELPPAWGSIRHRLEILFSGPGDYKPTRFCIPVDLVAFLCTVGGQNNGQVFFVPISDLVLLNSPREDVFGSDGEQRWRLLLEKSELWVEFCAFSASLRGFVCCALDSPLFGIVAVGDGHRPWLRSSEGLRFGGRNLLRFLSAFRTTADNGNENSWPNVPLADWATYYS